MARNDGCPPAFARTQCQRAGFDISVQQSEQLAGYLALLMQWNKAMNLVGARHWRDALENLIMDSFHLAGFLRANVLDALPPSPMAWDLGSGAGLPGIPLRMVWDDGKYWLVESRDKRTIFLSTVLARYPLKDTFVYRGRAEQFMDGKKADLIISRAFMPWQELLAFVKGHLNPGGQIVFLTKEELKDAPELPWRRTAHASYTVDKDTRHFCAFTEKDI